MRHLPLATGRDPLASSALHSSKRKKLYNARYLRARARVRALPWESISRHIARRRRLGLPIARCATQRLAMPHIVLVGSRLGAPCSQPTLVGEDLFWEGRGVLTAVRRALSRACGLVQGLPALGLLFLTGLLPRADLPLQVLCGLLLVLDRKDRAMALCLQDEGTQLLLGRQQFGLQLANGVGIGGLAVAHSLALHARRSHSNACDLCAVLRLLGFGLHHLEFRVPRSAAQALARPHCSHIHTVLGRALGVLVVPGVLLKVHGVGVVVGVPCVLGIGPQLLLCSLKPGFSSHEVGL
mmetsp:Transcript_120293/g.312214  ORF Transcript_120293/g.312214 Transcript_120293/m.312214 type:complete len:296 (+) Transcript_120293:202-1089(+)